MAPLVAPTTSDRELAVSRIPHDVRRFAIMIRRFTSDASKLRAGEYVRRKDGVTLCCPCCGLLSELGPYHGVDASGTVTPIWVCPIESCVLTGVWLELEGWAAGADRE